MKTPGVEVVHRCEFMGLGGIYNAMINLHDVKIPVDNRLAEEGSGLAMALATVMWGTLDAACPPVPVQPSNCCLLPVAGEPSASSGVSGGIA